jgi:urease accessory protein
MGSEAAAHRDRSPQRPAALVAPAALRGRADPETRPADAGWRAELELGFARRHGRTRLVRRWHSGPLRVQKPFYPRRSAGADPCQVVILHPPGGVVGGDHLAIDVRLDVGSRALITTPGATRFYRSAGREALQRVRLGVAREATLEWTPQETILFDGSRSRIDTRVQLDAGACFLGWEITALGRPASRAPFLAGLCRQSFEIEREGKPIWIERAEHRGGDESLAGRWGLAGHSAVGVLVCTGGEDPMLAAAREASADFSRDGQLAAATRRGELVILRALAPETRPIFDLFASLRESLLGQPAPAARIWAT